MTQVDIQFCRFFARNEDSKDFFHLVDRNLIHRVCALELTKYLTEQLIDKTWKLTFLEVTLNFGGLGWWLHH